MHRAVLAKSSHGSAARGGHLVIVARREDALLALKDELAADSQCIEVIVNLAQPGAAASVFSATEAAGIQIDYLINAGFGGHGKFVERDTAADSRMIQVNITALTELMHAYLPGMVALTAANFECLDCFDDARPTAGRYYATKACDLYVASRCGRARRYKCYCVGALSWIC